jgi:hypothetical protein
LRKERKEMELIVGKRYEWTIYTGGGRKVNGLFTGIYKGKFAQFMAKNGDTWLVDPEHCKEYFSKNKKKKR